MPSPDRDTRDVLKDLSKVYAFQNPDIDIFEVRKAYDRVFASWTAPSLKPTSESWVRVEALGSDNRCLVIEPDSANETGYTIVLIHGGGWSLGTSIGYAPLARWLCAEMGARVLLPDYPQAPEFTAPAATNALTGFLQWAAKAYENKLVLFGDSAGGNLVAVLSNHPPEGSEIIAQALLYPVNDLRPDAQYRSRKKYGKGKHFLTEDRIIGAAIQYCGDGVDTNSGFISPITETDFSRTPPTWHYVPELDPLYDECLQYADIVAKHGVYSQVLVVPRTIHGCASFCGRIPEAEKTLQRLCASMRAKLGQV